MRRDERDGVPVFWGQGSGRFTGAISFRVGRSDEHLTTGGVTHLVEHLALPTDRLRSVDFNGHVDGIETVFFATGARESVLELLAQMAAALVAPPLERLDVERTILLTEAAGRAHSAVRTASALRFGPVGHGLVGYDEYGLHGVDGDGVAAWVDRCFTRQNAVLWLTGEPPETLSLELPAGERLVPQPPEPIPYLRFPCAFDVGLPGAVTASLVAPRSHALTAVMSAAEHRLLRTLRYAEGLSYSVEWWYSALTANLGHTVITADTLEGNADRVRELLVSTLEDLAGTGPTEEELQFDLEDIRRHRSDPDSLIGYLTYAASNELLGLPFESEDQLDAERSAVTPADAAAALREALGSLLLIVPFGCGIGELERYPLASPSLVKGTRLRPAGFLPRRGGPRLIAGAEGLTLVDDDGELRTVRFDECEALLAWSDGTRGAWSRDGFYVEVDPKAWRGGSNAVRLLDDAVPAERRVSMDPDVADRIARVDEVVEGTVKRNWQTRPELERLPDFLESDEPVVAIAAASLGMKAGVVAVTDRRLLFVYLGNLSLELALEEVEAAERAPGGVFWDNKLVVNAGGGTHVFNDISPDEQVEALAAALAASRTSEASA